MQAEDEGDIASIDTEDQRQPTQGLKERHGIAEPFGEAETAAGGQADDPAKPKTKILR